MPERVERIWFSHKQLTAIAIAVVTALGFLMWGGIKLVSDGGFWSTAEARAYHPTEAQWGHLLRLHEDQLHEAKRNRISVQGLCYLTAEQSRAPEQARIVCGLATTDLR